MFRCVVVGFDGSDPSTRAYEQACAIVDADGRLVVVSAHTERAGVGEVDEQSLRSELEAELVALIEGSERVAEVIVRDGSPSVVLLAVGEDLGAEMIVVGRSGRKGLAQALLGSVSTAVAEQASVPVLVVP